MVTGPELTPFNIVAQRARLTSANSLASGEPRPTSGLGMEILIRKHRFVRLLDRDEGTLHGLVTGVAGVGELPIGLGEFRFVLLLDRLVEVEQGLPDDRLDEFDDAQPHPSRPLDRESVERL